MPNNYIYVAYNNVRISPHIWHYHIHGIYSYLYDNMYYLICKNCIYVTCIRNIFAHIYVHVWNTCHIFCDTVTYMTKYIWTCQTLHICYIFYAYKETCIQYMGSISTYMLHVCHIFCDTVTYMTKYIWTYMSNTAYMLHIWYLQGNMHTIYGTYMYIYVACMSHICLFRMGWADSWPETAGSWPG